MDMSKVLYGTFRGTFTLFSLQVEVNQSKTHTAYWIAILFGFLLHVFKQTSIICLWYCLSSVPCWKHSEIKSKQYKPLQSVLEIIKIHPNMTNMDHTKCIAFCIYLFIFSLSSLCSYIAFSFSYVRAYALQLTWAAHVIVHNLKHTACWGLVFGSIQDLIAFSQQSIKGKANHRSVYGDDG